MKRMLTIGIVVLAVAVVASSPLWAFRMLQNTAIGRVTAGYRVTCNASGGFAHWTIASIPWRLNTSGQGAGKEDALTAAAASWTNVAGANHAPFNAGTTTAGWATDGVNAMVWKKNGNGCAGGCLALTALVLQAGQVIVESDVTYNAFYAWRTTGADIDTQAVMAHELGHTLGIHHTEISSSPLPTMYASYFGVDERTLQADDESALQCSQGRYPVP